jgi:hypothetical protein
MGQTWRIRGGKVEGELIRYIVAGPLHWLGIVDPSRLNNVDPDAVLGDRLLSSGRRTCSA